MTSIMVDYTIPSFAKLSSNMILMTAKVSYCISRKYTLAYVKFFDYFLNVPFGALFWRSG